MSDLRAMVREILAEELGRLRPESATPRVREERVSVSNDAELTAFVHRLLDMAQDASLRADIAAGRHVFRLTAERAPTRQAHQPLAPASGGSSHSVRFETGLVTEKEVVKLPDGLARLSIGKTVRFTPLARDELRRRGIKVERKAS